MIDWQSRALAAESRVAELEAEVAALRERVVGRPASKATTKSGRIIARTVAALGITRTELADRLGVSPAAITRWATRDSLPTETAEALKALRNTGNSTT